MNSKKHGFYFWQPPHLHAYPGAQDAPEPTKEAPTNDVNHMQAATGFCPQGVSGDVQTPRSRWARP